MKVRRVSKGLKLTNDGQLSLFSLGVGSAFTRKHYQNNYVLIKNDKHLLIDCGTRTPDALFKLGLSTTDIKHVFITHSHADHTGGLEEIMLMARYVVRKKPNIIITKRYQELLWNDTLKGGAAWNESSSTGYMTFEDYWLPRRPMVYSGLNREAWEIDYEGFHLIIFRTMHYPHNAQNWEDSAFSTGLIIDKRVLFSADTRFDAELVNDITSKFDIEVIFHDVQFNPGGIHAYLNDLKTLPDDIRARMLLMHYTDNYKQFKDEVAESGFMGFVKQNYYYDFF